MPGYFVALMVIVRVVIGGSETIMIYVLSDIHGQKRRFESIMKHINLQPEDTLYVLGDVIDRNPDGI